MKDLNTLLAIAGFIVALGGNITWAIGHSHWGFTLMLSVKPEV
ncbi:hypothetical protein [aff. Roholtiella sp. LEGE 12411]|nr:hypothetical protein [aff. Roholtiella sp. LEGE 12411]